MVPGRTPSLIQARATKDPRSLDAHHVIVLDAILLGIDAIDHDVRLTFYLVKGTKPHPTTACASDTSSALKGP